jgi:hypothetical protein
MSEFQFIAFRAADGPVSEENLAYMRRQSSRAEITAWSFDNEYHYGDFGGNALEMLRRGYDIHLHYANFGIRRLLIRLPHGLPDPSAAEMYFGGGSLHFIADKHGQGGTLSIEPYHEPGDMDELWQLDGLMNRLVPLRAEILDGDLRPLYLANLAMACDGEHNPEETTEGPVPAGLNQLSDAQRALMDLYALSDALIAAAAKGGPPVATTIDPGTQYADWLQSLSNTTKDGWLAQWMTDSHSSVRQEILAEYRKSRNAPIWPTVRRDRTIAQLQTMAETIQEQTDRKRAERATRQRAKRLAAMAADPGPTLRETEKLVNQRSTEAYQQIAKLLCDLREALAGSGKAELAEQQAQNLKKKHPTLKLLNSELRRAGLLRKRGEP